MVIVPLAEAASKGSLRRRKDWPSLSLPTTQDFLAMAPAVPASLGAFYNLRRCADRANALDTGRIISSNPFRLIWQLCRLEEVLSALDIKVPHHRSSLALPNALRGKQILSLANNSSGEMH